MAWYRYVGWAGTNRLTRWLHVPLYRLFAGSGILGRSLGNLTIVLTTVGARSGRHRSVPLWAFRDHEAWVVVASNGGSARLPAWCLNLRANPRASVQNHARVTPVRAREAEGAEYERLWIMVTTAYRGYAAYRRWAGRPIPLVVLEPEPVAATEPGEPA